MSKITFYQEACNKVKGFHKMGETFMRRLVIEGKSKSVHENYLRQMAKLSLHYGRIPLMLQTSEVEEYLFFLILRHGSCLHEPWVEKTSQFNQLFFLPLNHYLSVYARPNPPARCHSYMPSVWSGQYL